MQYKIVFLLFLCKLNYPAVIVTINILILHYILEFRCRHQLITEMSKQHKIKKMEQLFVYK